MRAAMNRTNAHRRYQRKCEVHASFVVSVGNPGKPLD